MKLMLCILSRTYSFAPRSYLEIYFQQIHLLDAGCGTGNYSKAMINCGVGHVTLIDGSDGMLKKARAKLANEIAIGKVDDIRVHSMPTIPYHDAHFDAVMFNLVSISIS